MWEQSLIQTIFSTDLQISQMCISTIRQMIMEATSGCTIRPCIKQQQWSNLQIHGFTETQGKAELEQQVPGPPERLAVPFVWPFLHTLLIYRHEGVLWLYCLVYKPLEKCSQKLLPKFTFDERKRGQFGKVWGQEEQNQMRWEEFRFKFITETKVPSCSL